MNQHPVVIAGPTGSGKSELAVRLALACNGEIVNYDSVQIYRGFDIGSAKPSVALRREVPHHLFDIVEADEEFNAAAYSRLARATCLEIAERGRLPILVGGTFFYLRAFLSGLPEMPGRNERLRQRIRAIADRPRGAARLHAWLSKVDPQSGGKIAPGDRHRVERALEVWLETGEPISNRDRPDGDAEELPATKLGLAVGRAALVPLLEQRVDTMYADGLVGETRGLLERFGRHVRPFGAIGYKEAVAVIEQTMTEQEAVVETKRRTRAYAKRQMTWLRSERNLHWLDASDRERTFVAAMQLLAK